MTTPPLIHLVADYGESDLAFAEVIQRLKAHLPKATIIPTSVPPFSTLATGFVISQLALYDPLPGMFIYSNTAPRRDDTEKRHQNEGEPFVYARLTNGVRIAAVHAEYALSFVKSQIRELRKVKVQNRGSQFRSRDFFPQAAVGILKGDERRCLGEKLPLDILDIPERRIMYIDGYGNIKTTIRESEFSFRSGEKIRISVNGNVRTAVSADANFEVKMGDLAFAPGSSGGQDRFMEIFLRSGNAYKLFFEPPIESEIRFERFED